MERHPDGCFDHFLYGSLKDPVPKLVKVSKVPCIPLLSITYVRTDIFLVFASLLDRKSFQERVINSIATILHHTVFSPLQNLVSDHGDLVHLSSILHVPILPQPPFSRSTTPQRL